MTFKKLKTISAPHFYALSLDRFFPKKLRNVLRKIAALGMVVSFFFSFDSLPLYLGFADGLFFLFIAFYLSLAFLEFFYRSMSNFGLLSRPNDDLINKDQKIDFALSSILVKTNEIDVTKSFFETSIGMEILVRSGVVPQDANNFIYSERPMIIATSLNLVGDEVGLSQYAAAVYDADKSFQSFLSQNSINKEEFVGTAEWIESAQNQKKRKERFWSRENLGAMPSIGTSWSYGTSSDLGKYGVNFENLVNLFSLSIENRFREREVAALEGILERGGEANAIIIDDDESVAKDIIARFLKKIKLGIAPPILEYKNIIELDWNALVADFKNKAELESEILQILNQSAAAGNVIIFIRDLSGFVSSVKPFGISLPSLISPYLSASNLSVIASATNTDFHFFIETVPTLLEKFERIIPDKAGVEASVNVLLEKVPEIENQYKFYFSYPSILAIAKTADRFITYGEMPGKAVDMMIEIAPWADQKNIVVLKENDVSVFASEKTGIATGDVKEQEAEKISHLEELLHKRVVGQDEAISSIASAVRRARSGVNNPKRPLASFLFIGPTGVGKTEVSKALAESFFGDEKKMIRFDMSEYSGPDAIPELLGEFAENKSGLLASRVRDNPYSVLLLDEFEKAAPDVLDLFLQILDEGMFTDALGKQVNCRNLIIIATSNAGSDMIWQTVKSGKDLLQSKNEIINKIISDKIFRPELLNRFDGIILFHPLQNEELANVAKLELQKLAKRLKEKDIEFVINDDVVNFLVSKSDDPQFGGRAINRLIQNNIENLVAQKIINREVPPGGKIEIKTEELR